MLFSWTCPLFLTQLINRYRVLLRQKALTYKLTKTIFNILYPIESEVPHGSILGPVLFSFLPGVNMKNNPDKSEQFLNNPFQNDGPSWHFVFYNIKKTSTFPNLSCTQTPREGYPLRDCIYISLNSLYLTTPKMLSSSNFQMMLYTTTKSNLHFSNNT